MYLRFSKGPAHDRDRRSHDYESGLELSGLSVNLMDNADDGCRPWVLRGKVVARGPENGPLVAEYEPLALLAGSVVAEAKRRYARFDVAEVST